MFNRVLVVSVSFGLSAAAFAAPDDPNAMMTNNLNATTSYYTLNDSDSHYFSPASAYTECAHAQVGAMYNASMTVTDRCSSTTADIDVVEFQWSNYNMYSPFFSLTATGNATSSFSVLQDAEISLSSIQNYSALDSSASWSASLYDGSFNLIGSLSSYSNTYSLTKDTDYNVVFTIGGNNTLTAGGSTVAWQMAMAYAGDSDTSGGDGGGDGGGDDGGDGGDDQSGGSAVAPGAGGLALLGSMGFSRRRRRH